MRPSLDPSGSSETTGIALDTDSDSDSLPSLLMLQKSVSLRPYSTRQICGAQSPGHPLGEVDLFQKC